MFAVSDYRERVVLAQHALEEAGLAALWLTTDADIRYFTGFLTRFWESPTRPWHLIVPASGDPIAVIPGIGEPLMRRGWLRDVRTWDAPDYDDDGVSLLIDALRGCGGPIGTPMGLESHLRMPLSDFAEVRSAVEVASDQGIMAGLRAIKSDAEIALIRRTCDGAARAFARVPEIAEAGVALDTVFRRFQMLCLEEGADWVPYLAGGAGPGGYADVISPAESRPLERGDVLMLDTGCIRHGYFCDFNRNFALGDPGAEAREAHATLIEATHAAFELAQPGVTAAELFGVMDDILTGGTGATTAGRYGHGLGLQLTEGLSLLPADTTILQPGMVLTLEPSVQLSGARVLVHEENIAITEDGAVALTTFAGPEMIAL